MAAQPLQKKRLQGYVHQHKVIIIWIDRGISAKWIISRLLNRQVKEKQPPLPKEETKEDCPEIMQHILPFFNRNWYNCHTQSKDGMIHVNPMMMPTLKMIMHMFMGQWMVCYLRHCSQQPLHTKKVDFYNFLFKILYEVYVRQVE